MNEELLAADAFLVQSGSLLVCVGIRFANCKDISVLPEVR
jgi:hypothetical protein